MNFGTLKDIFVENLIDSHVSGGKKGKLLYKKFLKTLKENKTLRDAFIIYKNIETKTFNSEVEAIEYIKESISVFNNYRGENSLPSQVKKLTTLLDESSINYKNREIKPIHLYLENLITLKKDINTLDKIHESKTNLVSWLLSNKETVNENKDEEYIRKNIDPKKFLNVAVEKFNEKYKDSLTEEEKNILKVLRNKNNDEIKTLVSNLVKENISLVNQHLENTNNDEIKSKLLETKDVIYKMMENNDSFGKNVLKLFELKNNLKND